MYFQKSTTLNDLSVMSGQNHPLLLTIKDMGDEMDASIHRTGVAMRHTGIGRL
jgi:hypothetical protein